MPPILGAELCVTSIQEPRPHFRNNISPALALQSEECAKSILMKIHPAKHARTNLIDQLTEMNAGFLGRNARKEGQEQHRRCNMSAFGRRRRTGGYTNPQRYSIVVDEVLLAASPNR